MGHGSSDPSFVRQQPSLDSAPCTSTCHLEESLLGYLNFAAEVLPLPLTYIGRKLLLPSGESESTSQAARSHCLLKPWLKPGILSPAINWMEPPLSHCILMEAADLNYHFLFLAVISSSINLLVTLACVIGANIPLTPKILLSSSVGEPPL